MEGVEILNTFVEGGCSLGAGMFSIVLGILAIVALIAAIYLLWADPDAGGAALMFSIILLCLSTACIYKSFFKEEDTTYYQVIIDDSVSMVEFNEKYDIVNIEGKIYTIREKGN